MAPTPTSASATSTLFPIHTLFRFVAFSKVCVFLVILKWVFVFLLRNEFGRSSTRTHDGTKFAVTERPVKQVRQEFCTETAETFIEEQKSRWGKCF
ncbi:hypothetical protein RGQ29_023927 [Quercus rubra]|uniref:Uncharacterized protein n=1 Tax=Quercus rubra TaxID=3512 RepID=A0AAN7F9E3_QUERU|nr:hypothetical protein RGQ29_023927 [Quercus rubra]